MRRAASAENMTPHHLPGLNGLRAAACLAVFGVHFHQHTEISGRLGDFDTARLLENGNTGVALFFVLSGFLLGLPYWSGAHNPGTPPKLATYAIRRVTRILPAYFLCLTVLVLTHGHWSTPKQFANTVFHYLLIHNLAEFSFYGISEPFWTIAVQAHFYLFLPLLLTLLRPLGTRVNVAFASVLTLCIGCFALHQWIMTQAANTPRWPIDPRLISPGGAVLSHSVLAHLPHFLIGVLSGRVFLLLGSDSKRLAKTVAVTCEVVFWTAGAAIFTILGTPLDDRLQLPYGRYHFPIVPVLIAAVIVTAPLAKQARRILEARPLSALGTISYGFYLFHLPCQNVTGRTMRFLGMEANHHWMIFGLASLAVSIAVATVSYRFLERPLLLASRPNRQAS